MSAPNCCCAWTTPSYDDWLKLLSLIEPTSVTRPTLILAPVVPVMVMVPVIPGVIAIASVGVAAAVVAVGGTGAVVLVAAHIAFGRFGNYLSSARLAGEIATRRKMQNPDHEEWLRATPQPTLDLIASFQRTVIEELLRRAAASVEAPCEEWTWAWYGSNEPSMALTASKTAAWVMARAREATGGLTRAGFVAWWLLPVAVLAVTAVSLRRAVGRELRQERPS